jgi:mannose-6-phosphate isomerase-like protein (cupin superfamily)
VSATVAPSSALSLPSSASPGIPQSQPTLHWVSTLFAVADPTHPMDVEAARTRLAGAGGGYEIIHESAGLELGVYVLVAPEPDRQQPHEDDEVYIVLEGTGRLDVEGSPVDLREGHAVFVPAGAEHRFTGYEQLSVLVIFERKP